MGNILYHSQRVTEVKWGQYKEEVRTQGMKEGGGGHVLMSGDITVMNISSDLAMGDNVQMLHSLEIKSISASG